MKRPFAGVLGLLALSLAGCAATDFTERRRLADPIMALEDTAGETHLYGPQPFIKSSRTPRPFSRTTAHHVSPIQ